MIQNLVMTDKLIINFISFHEIDDLCSKYLEILPKQKLRLSERKQQEHILGRLCGQQDLNNIVQIINGSNGAPIWLDGSKGSISHSKDFAVSAFSTDASCISLGIDVEQIVNMKRFAVLKSRVLTLSEMEDLKSIKLEGDKLKYATLIFSAKETLYKLINPLVNEYFGFYEGVVESIDIEAKTFQIALKSQNQSLEKFLGVYSGEFRELDNNILTWIQLFKD